MGKLTYEISRLRFYIKKVLKKHKYTVEGDVRCLVNEISKNGFAVVQNFYTEQECFLLREELDKLIEKRINENTVWIDKAASDYRCFGAEDDSNLIARFHNDKFLNAVADNYFRAKMTCSNTLAAKIIYKDNNIGSGQGWHRDGNQLQFKALIYLSDVEYKDGPFQIFSGSHKRLNILKHIELMRYDGKNTRFTNEQIEKIMRDTPEQYKILMGKAGTVVLFDSSTIHAGLPLSAGGGRYALTNYYMPSYEDVNAQRNVFMNAHKKQK